MNNLFYKESLAYDFKALPKQSEIQKQSELRAVKTKNKAKKAKTFISIKAMLITVAIGTAMVINAYASLTSVSDKAAKLAKDIQKLKNEEVFLKAQSEKMTQLSNVESYVQSHLDMTKMAKDQVEYVELANPDMIIMKKSGIGKSTSRVYEGIKNIVFSVLEYIS